MVIAGSDRGLSYAITLSVPHYERRCIRVSFRVANSRLPMVTADGPSSPHRYDDGRLCLWYRWDSRDRRWEVEDGLLQLLCIVTEHLFKEAWWRETGEWLGDEVLHDPEGIGA